MRAPVVSEELRTLRRAGRQQPRIPHMPWAAHAACQAHDPEQWMDDQPGRPTAAVAAAKAVCAACPVRAACLAHALAYDEPWGIWGGLTTRERVARRQERAITREEPRPYTGVRGPRKTKPRGSRKTKPRIPAELKERAVQRYIEGQGSFAGIAKELGVSTGSVGKWVRAASADLAS